MFILLIASSTPSHRGGVFCCLSLISGKLISMSQRTQFWLIATLILLMAAFFRFHRLADLPLGLFFDLAINGLDALRIIERGGLTLFFPTNGGRESLSLYLLAGAIKLFGTIPLTPRFLTASFSLLTVAALYGFLHNMSQLIFSRLFNLGNQENQANHGHIFAALTLAISYWHVTISRLGERAVILPLTATLTYWFFLRGWYRGQTRWFIAAGFMMGLGSYIYSAARLIPVILLIALLPELIWPSPVRRGRLLRQLALFFITAFITASPMLGYFLSHPAQLTARASSVMVWQFLPNNYEIMAELGRNTLRVLGFFGYVGNPNPMFGLPNEPGLSPFLTPFLIIGLFIAIKNGRDLFYRLIVIWWLIGLIPSIIAIEAPHPLRLIVAMVPTAVLVGLGLASILQTSQVFKTCEVYTWKRIYYGIVIFGYGFIALNLYQNYFISWANLKVTHATYDYGAVAIRQTIEQLPPDKPLYLPLSRYNDSPLLYYLGDSFPRQAALTVTIEASARVISPDKNRNDTVWVRLYHHTATILPPMNETGLQIIQTALSASTAPPVQLSDGEIVARLAELPLDPAQFIQTPTQPITATFGNINLMAATYPMMITTTDILPVTFFWQTTAPIPDEYEILVHLVNDSRQALGNGDARPNDWVYPTTFWQPNGEIIPAQHLIQLNNPLSPGRYWLAVAVFNPLTQQRLPLTSDLSDSLDTMFIGPLKVALPPPNPRPMQPISATFGTAIQLQGYEVANGRMGEEANNSQPRNLAISLYWLAIATPDRDYTVFIHLLDEAGNIVAGSDSQPINGQYPTSIWSPHERLLDLHTLTIPSDLPSGQYYLTVGLYHQPSGQRLPLTWPNGQVDAAGELKLSDEKLEVKNEN